MIRHVLLDADGVLQRHPDGWVEAAARFVGGRAADFFRDVTLQERTCLRGEAEFLPLLTAQLERYGVPAPAEQVYAEVWQRIEAVDSSVALVHALRELGLGVHLATNQQPLRAGYMRREMHYDDLFDESFYSCEMGVMKPEPAFFLAALDRLDARAPEVVFVDDHPGNVAAACEVGLAAEQWSIADGVPALERLLSAHGLVPGRSA